MKKNLLLSTFILLAILTITFQACKKENLYISPLFSFTDTRDGQTYDGVVIGSQTWMAENLNFKTSNSWVPKDDSVNGIVYGRLYTWDSSLEVCPDNWHLPTDDEWKILEKALGMDQFSADSLCFRGFDEGKQLKSTYGWAFGKNGMKGSYFNAFPGGMCNNDGEFYVTGYSGYWWTSTPYDNENGLYRELSSSNDHIWRFFYTKNYGMSVRCIKD